LGAYGLEQNFNQNSLLEHLSGNWKPKKSIKKLIDEEMTKPDVQQINTPRHTITVDDFSFRARLKKELSRAQIA
jgi:hypothetical protein